MPEAPGSDAQRKRNDRKLLIVAVVVGLVLLAGWWSTRMLRARKAAWLASVRATGAKAGIEKKDYDDLGEIISQFTVGDHYLVWVDQPSQIRAILDLPDAPPPYVMFIVACDADRQELIELRERSPKSSVSHSPYLRWSDMTHPSYADVR